MVERRRRIKEKVKNKWYSFRLLCRTFKNLNDWLCLATSERLRVEGLFLPKYTSIIYHWKDFWMRSPFLQSVVAHLKNLEGSFLRILETFWACQKEKIFCSPSVWAITAKNLAVAIVRDKIQNYSLFHMIQRSSHFVGVPKKFVRRAPYSMFLALSFSSRVCIV